nr:hypothetical protein [Streptomyces sp. AA1529]
MTCYETGERSRLIHAVREYNGRENQPKGFGSRKRIQYRPHLIDCCLAATGLVIDE